MSDPSEYIAAAAVLVLRDTKLSDLPTSRGELAALINEKYGISLDSRDMSLLVEQLGKWEMVGRIQDEFAGEMLQLRAAKSDTTWAEAETEILDKAWEGGRAWLDRVFSNDAYWAKLADQPIEETPPAHDNAGPVPASDRLVTLSHNQFAAINPLLDQTIEAAERHNGDPEQPGLRERIIGQLRAGRELLRAGVFNAQIFYLTMISGLKIMIDRYGETAAGELAKKLLDVIIEHIGDSLL